MRKPIFKKDKNYTFSDYFSFNYPADEIAKREVIIAPLLHALIRQIDVRLNIEYPLNVEDIRLGGSLDYLLRGQQEIVVIEAKKHDLDRGFNQLMAELIALDHYEDAKKPSILYGAITVGESWRFVQLNRKKKCILRDIHSFRFPEDTRDILAILKGLLTKI